MSKKRIFVGVEYEDAFESIYTLIAGKCFDGLPYSVGDGVISDGTYEYVLSDKKREASEQVKFTFEEDGATWFKALRGEKVPDDDSVWNTFRSNIVIEYHKRFSVVEYKHRAPSLEERERALKAATSAVRQFCKTFYPDMQEGLELAPIKDSDLLDDIFGVAMKIDLSGGTGASLPVLGKVYFNRVGKLMTPLVKDVAAAIDNSVNAVIPDEDGATPPSNDTLVLDNALDSMQALIEDTERNFADYIHFSNKSDRAAVYGLLAKLSHDAVELECQRVDILYITHIQTNAYEFIAYAQGKPMLKIQLGINDTVSIQCINCTDDSMIVDRNQIVYFDEAGNVKSAFLDFSAIDFGVSKSLLDEIKATGVQNRHFMPISCKGVQGKKSCSAFRCESQIFEATVDNKPIFVCKDCPYPEVVYTTPSGEKKYTPLLSFAFDKMELVSPAQDGRVSNCTLCGRAFSEAALHSGSCPICYKADRQLTEQSKKLFKVYKDYLPLSVRSKKGEKACFEDDEVILFVVGNKRYMFNKLNVKDTGYVSKPKQIR